MSSILHEIGPRPTGVGSPAVVSGSGDASADPPEAEPGEQDGEANEDAGLRPLQGPEVAGGVVGEVLAQAEGAHPLLAGLGPLVKSAVLLVGGAVEHLAGGGDGLVG